MTEFQNQAVVILEFVDSVLDKAKTTLLSRVSEDGRLPDSDQYAAHSFAWIATTVEALRQLHAWSERIEADGNLGEFESLLVRICFGEYTWQILGGIPMSQGETARLSDVGISLKDFNTETIEQVIEFAAATNSAANRVLLAKMLGDFSCVAGFGRTGLDEELEEIRSQIRRFAVERIIPSAQGWHLRNELLPSELVRELAEMGVFGLTIPEEFEGAGLSKTAMCVVSEELSRGFLGAGSLATRSEIAAELVRCGGTDEQKREWLPKIASGEVLPTAVFTEPNAGSDLGSLKTRAEIHGDTYRIFGSKTWITHAVRANLMTMLVRTEANSRDYRGLSLLLAEKKPGTQSEEFPDHGISGSEIEVIGYRGMKEYSIDFDGFEVGRSSLLGGVEGQGFRQLMETFESARIQTAARAIGVAQSALDAAYDYACERKQFGKSLAEFPRVGVKLAMMAVEIMVCRQLTYFAARRKDSGRRCDLEAGMAKLLAARAAWSSADSAVQIHGGNGFARECPVSRILCDSRILSIFEGASEIQAGVITSRLLKQSAN